MSRRVTIAGLLIALVVAIPSLAGAQPSATEQWLVYELNRARWDPAAYAAETGISIPATILPAPPLAVSPELSSSSRAKARHMADCQCLSHVINGVYPNRLARNHGYPLPGHWPDNANYIESLYRGSTQPIQALRSLMGGSAHRDHLFGQTLFFGSHREVGIGWLTSSGVGNLAVHTAHQHNESNRLFVTGVVYADGNGNGRMDPAEGRSGVTVSVVGGASTTTNAGGGYSLPVSPGRWTIRASGNGFGQQEVAVTVGEYNVGVDFVSGRARLVRQYADGLRLAGDDRYGTAVAVSRHHYPDPSQVSLVFVATGADFPDALAGAAIAGKLGAPLLLTAGTSLPQVTRDELARLGPDHIVILGGTAAIGSSVAGALGEYGQVTRLDGSDRYETAARVSRYGFPGSASVVFIATGTAFADALASAPAAVRRNGPILLTERGTLPAATRAEIVRLGPSQVVILGGTAAVSATVEGQLKALVPNTIRLAGANRYETAVAVANHAFPNSATPVAAVYLTLGTDFPDALAGAAAAAAVDAPILLTPPTQVHPFVGDEIRDRLRPGILIVLGGTTALSPGLHQAHLNLLG